MPKKITKKIAVPAATPGIKRPGVLKKVRPSKKKVAKISKGLDKNLSLISRPLPKGPCCTPVDRDGAAFKIPFGYSDILGTKKIVSSPVTNIVFYDREKSPYNIQANQEPIPAPVPIPIPVVSVAASEDVGIEIPEPEEEVSTNIFPRKTRYRRSNVEIYTELLILDGVEPNNAMALANAVPKEQLRERINVLKVSLEKKK